MSDRPTAAPAYFPYPHLSLAEVWAEEAAKAQRVDCKTCGEEAVLTPDFWCGYGRCPLKREDAQP